MRYATAPRVRGIRGHSAGAPPSGGGALIDPLFFSNFSAALGTGNTAITDGSKWGIGGYGHEVVASTGLDFPSANVCRFGADYANSGFCLLQKSGLPSLAVGSTRYYRWYVRMTFPDALVGNGDHPWQDGNAVSDSCWLFGVHYGSDDSPAHDADWRAGVSILRDAGDGGTIDCTQGPWLTKGVTFRLEVAVQRLSSTTFDLRTRIHNTAGALLYTGADMPAAFGGGTLDSRGPYAIKAAQQAGFGDYFNIGTNDFETAGNDWWNQAPYSGLFTYGYQGCVAIADRVESIAPGVWIGAYGTVTGET